MNPAQTGPRARVRGRRLASYGFDLLLFAVPWLVPTVLAAMAHSNGARLDAVFVGGCVAVACTVALIVAQAIFFLRRGRTLGMRATALVAVSGIRWLALLLDPLLAVVALLVAIPIVFAAGAATDLQEDYANALIALAPAVALAGNLCFLLGREGRTLTDRMSGLRVEHRPPG